MCDEWMPHVTIPLSGDQYVQLPRHSAYQYDYLHGTAYLSPRPKHFHAVLEFAKRQRPDPEEVSPDVQLRPMLVADHALLPAVFADAFEHIQPFGGLTTEQRRTAARVALDRTWQGGDGPWLRQASFTAGGGDAKNLLGAIAITLVPGGDPGTDESYRWTDPPPETKELAGQPHLTWIFVSPLWKGGGLGSALLDRAVTALQRRGYTSLWTTFLMGNDASMLWHWRNGFTLAPSAMSRRVLRRETRKRSRN